MFVDSHCHLSFDELHAQLDAILDKMQAAQVDRALCICTRLEEFDRVHALAVQHPNLWASVGCTPTAKTWPSPAWPTWWSVPGVAAWWPSARLGLTTTA
jgi:TatD DNase family protein